MRSLKNTSRNVWEKLKENNPKGFFILAPMADITDNPFRKIINEIGRPDLFYIEFASVDGLASKKGRRKIEKKILNFDRNQRPIIAQIFGGDSQNFREAVGVCRKLGFDGIDINMGCPQKNIIKQGSGADLIRDYERAKKIFLETKQGAKQRNLALLFKKKSPVSVKTRIGFDKLDLNWIKEVLSWKPDAFIIHLRTKKEMSKVPAHWELMEDIRKLRDSISPNTILIGNGDISSLEEGREKIKKYKIDGVMIGRGIFQNPFLFSEKSFQDFSPLEKINLALKHARYFDQEFPLKENNKRDKNFALMKKFFKIYINGFEGAKELRMKMMAVNTLEELEKICYNWSIKNIK